MIAISLAPEQKQTVVAILKPYHLEDYADQVELVITQQAAGEWILRLIGILCQTSYLRGKAEAHIEFNRAIDTKIQEALEIKANLEDFWKNVADGSADWRG